jgi:hypothetical protein
LESPILIGMGWWGGGGSKQMVRFSKLIKQPIIATASKYSGQKVEWCPKSGPYLIS